MQHQNDSPASSRTLISNGVKSITSTALVLAAFFIPSFASAAWSFNFQWGPGACTNSICGVAATIIGIINGLLVPLIFALAFIVFLWGVASAYIFSRGDAEKVKDGHRLILWGIIGFVVMISLWGLVNVVATTFGLGGISAPPPPTSYPL